MKNAEIMAIIKEVFPATDKDGNEIRVNCTVRGNGYGIQLVRCFNEGLTRRHNIGYAVRVYGIQGEAAVRAKLEAYAATID